MLNYLYSIETAMELLLSVGKGEQQVVVVAKNRCAYVHGIHIGDDYYVVLYEYSTVDTFDLPTQNTIYIERENTCVQLGWLVNTLTDQQAIKMPYSWLQGVLQPLPMPFLYYFLRLHAPELSQSSSMMVGPTPPLYHNSYRETQSEHELDTFQVLVNE